MGLHPEPKKWKAPKGPKAVQRKNKNTIGLGKTLQYARQQENRVEYLPDGEMRFTTDKQEAKWVKLRSITQETALDEFLTTAELADKDFTAEKRSAVKIIRMDNAVNNNQYLLSSEEEKLIAQKQREFAAQLIVPRRPDWDEGMTRFQLERQEKEAFLNWRRKLAELQQDNEDLLLTPFERNIEVWRQLWRVVERSDLVVQIVDARNPILFRSVDLDNYVTEINPDKRKLLLVNKADLLTVKQRVAWARYFKRKGIKFTFFSAAKANEILEKEELGEEVVEVDEDLSQVDEDIRSAITILKIDQLEELFLSAAPSEPLVAPKPGQDPMIQIGLVGYPNVGKSSTINALVGSKKVSVSSTPGKTKHFQTIRLSSRVMLCDCPGLVFPNFAYTNGELVCNGVLPIDQLREYTGPAQLVAQRVPKYFLEAVYGIHIPVRSKEDGGDGVTPTAQELLTAYARARGYMTQGFGSADEPRSARYILKDYVNGKLLFINPPPHEDDSPCSREEQREFNNELYTFEHLPESRREQLLEAAQKKGITTLDLANDLQKLSFSSHIGESEGKSAKSVNHGGKQAALYNATEDLDKEFFNMNAITGKLTTPFHKQQKDSGKKHNKGNKKAKKKAEMMYSKD